MFFSGIVLQAIYKNKDSEGEGFRFKDGVDKLGFKMSLLALLTAIIGVVVIFSGLYFTYSFFGLLP